MKNPTRNQPTDRIQGEGDYEAGRRYDKAAQEFTKSGKVAKAARQAKPRDRAEEDQMLEAERIGQSHAKP